MKTERNLLVTESYKTNFDEIDEAEAWVAFVRLRVKNIDKKHNAIPKTKVSYEISSDGKVKLTFETSYYASEELFKLILPIVVLDSLEECLGDGGYLPKELFIPISALNVSTRLKKALKTLECEYLGDALAISEEELRQLPLVGKKTWHELCDLVESYEFNKDSYIQSWKPKNAEEISKKYYPGC